jgi:dipeptidyl aminopeptidase/acylaminoacyl peptidase
MNRRTVRLVCAVFSALVFVIECNGTSLLISDRNHADPPVFRVKDSIEIAYIENPIAYSSAVELRERQATGAPITSPDGKRFLLITQRGIVTANKIEAAVWVFDRNATLAYARDPSRLKPKPSAVVVMSATSNNPVISDVRWLDDSNRVSFLGRNGGPNSQLFIVDTSNSSLTEVTEKSLSVVAYDIQKDTIAYSTLVPRATLADSEQTSEDLIDVTGKNIYSLLDTSSHSGLADYVDEWSLRRFPTVLHVQKRGQDLACSFSRQGNPLRLFAPVFRLSPDGRSLIALGPVTEIPSGWIAYRPRLPGETYQLRPGDRWAVAEPNPNKAEQFVSVDLENCQATALIDAPAGRGLGYSAPTGVIWSADGRRALLLNTFLPIDAAADEKDKGNRSRAPALVIVDIPSRTVQPITYMAQSRLEQDDGQKITNISWKEANGEVDVEYSGPVNSRVSSSRAYALKSGAWVQVATDVKTGSTRSAEVDLAVEEDLNHPPTLTIHRNNRPTGITVWDPNPQLNNLALGFARPYQWKDAKGYSWKGILMLPPDHYPSDHRYPLVIQTHGYNASRFFADGEYTTGSGGRALAGRGIAVLQIDMPMIFFRTPKDGPFQLGGLASAISDLAKKKLVDPKRVGVIGFSYTCFHVLYALTHRPDLFVAASTTDGNQAAYLQYLMATDYVNGSARGFQDVLEKTNGGSPFGPGLLAWFRHAPSFNLDRVKTPLLMSAFAREERLGQWEVYAALRMLHKPVNMIWLKNPNIPHILVKPSERYASQQMAVDWFDFWLNKHENPDPGRAWQYVGWRNLRRMETQRLESAIQPRN